MTEPTAYDAEAPLVTPPARPAAVAEDEWRENLSEPARYGGEAPDLSREQAATDDAGEPAHRFREILVQTQDLQWVEKTLAGLTHKALWRNEDTGASIASVPGRYTCRSYSVAPCANASSAASAPMP